MTADEVRPAFEEDAELARAVKTPADLAMLSEDDRLRISSWLAVANLPARLPPEAQRRRRRALLVATLAAVSLFPWSALLAITLPDQHRATQWRVAWVVFDLALAIGFAATAWFGWRGRQAVITCLVITATLLLCDAWFDIALSWGGTEQTTSVFTALVIEVPLAVFLLSACYRILGALTAQAWRDQGRPGRPPALRHVPLLLRVEGPDVPLI